MIDRWVAALGRALFVLIFLGCVTSAQVRACPNCKEAVSAQTAEGSRAADGYNWSILLMLAIPFSMMGAGTMMVRRAVKQGAFPEL